jgi:hypothetical protein
MPGRIRIATFPSFDPFVDVANLDKFGVELDSFASIGNSISICLSLDMCLIPVVRKKKSSVRGLTIAVITHLSSVGEERRLFVVQVDGLTIEVNSANVIA